MIDTNCIGAELLHQSGIKLALFGIDERVLVNELVGNS